MSGARHERGVAVSGPAAGAFEQVNAIGPFFAFETYDPASPPGEPWQPLRELVARPGPLAERVRGVRAQLAATAGQPPEAVELRVAASVAQLGLVARLVSPALAAAALVGTVPPLGLDVVHWQPRPGGLFPLSLPVPAAAVAPAVPAVPAPPAALAAALGGALLEGPVRELVEAVRPLSVSARVLWGNVASALGGAVTVLTASPGVSPDQAARARVIAALLLEQPGLRGTAGTDARGRFRRRSCCLIYRASPRGPGGARALCGDCVLAGPGTSGSGTSGSGPNGPNRPPTGGGSGVS
jgi:FhuF 2Fe-2S C-terminal domain